MSLVFANQIIVTEKISPTTGKNCHVIYARLSVLYCVGRPDLPKKIVTQCYEAVELRTRPGRHMKIEPELLLIHEKGAGFWSHELHCWVTGYFDNKGVFIPPDWGV